MRMARAPDFVAGHGAAQHHRIAAQPQYLRRHRLCTYSHPGRVLLRPGEDLFLCRSTAPVRKGASMYRICGGCSYGREEGCTFVGAPPRCEPGGHAFAPAAGAPTVGRRGCFCVGAPPRCEWRGIYRTRGGCAYASGEGLYFCSSTAPVRTAWTPFSGDRRVLWRPFAETP